MDIYILDSAFRKTDVVDEFTSLVWTERYNEAGDVTLVVPTNGKHSTTLVEGAFLSIDASKDVMMIHTKSTEGGQITLTGDSLTKFLAQRMLRNTWSTAKQAWSLTGVPGSIAGTIVSAMCMPGGIMDLGNVVVNGDKEVISHLSLGALATGTSTTIAVPYGNVYDGVKLVCDLDDLGFRMYPTNITTTDYDLKFTTYAGKDRTSSQSTNAVVIFEPALDSFTNVKELRSRAGFVTTAYVFPSGATGQFQVGVAYAVGYYLLTDFSRRTLMVDASDINVADFTATELDSVVNQRARDTLANNNYVRLTDGEIVPQTAFVYGTDYALGDVIELRNLTSVGQKARITEYIRAQDASGETAYPTLSVID